MVYGKSFLIAGKSRGSLAITKRADQQQSIQPNEGSTPIRNKT
jgi:hypothetical protein